MARNTIFTGQASVIFGIDTFDRTHCIQAVMEYVTGINDSTDAPSLCQVDLTTPLSAHFSDFPRACGFEITDTGQPRRLEKRQYEDLERTHAFVEALTGDFEHHFTSTLQHWLIFGVLREVFGCLGQDFRVEDFKVVAMNDDYFSTRELGSYLEKWYQLEVYGSSRTLSHARMAHVQTVLGKARRIVRNNCAARYSDKECDGAPLWSNVDPKTILSIIVLGEALQHGALSIMKAIDFCAPDWYESADMIQGWGFSHQYLEDHFWRNMCPRDLHILLGNLNESTIGLIHARRNVRLNQEESARHLHCRATLCRAHEPNEPRDAPGRVQYKQAHLRSHQTSANVPSAAQLPEMRRQLKQILEDSTHKIPVLSWNIESQTLVVHELDDAHPFVAVSHAWSDGFGNPSENSICACVLDFLTKLRNNHRGVYSTRHMKVNPPWYFWIDTLLVPAGETDEDRRLRSLAVDRIPAIYRRAQATFVLSNDLIYSRSSPEITDISMMILMCQWMNRLWPLQESVLSTRVYFIFDAKDDRLVSLDDLEREFVRKGQATPVEHAKTSISRQFYSNMLGSFRLGMRDASRLRQPETSGHLYQIIKAARFRQTKYRSHETLAYASLLQWRPDQMTRLMQQELPQSTHSALEVDERKAEARMIHFLDMMTQSTSRIPTLLVFLPGRRLRDTFYSWAPSTLMSSYAFPFSNDSAVAKRPAALDREYGINVQAPGMQLLDRDRKVTRPFMGRFECRVQCDSGRAVWYRLRLPTQSDALARQPGSQNTASLFGHERDTFSKLSTSEDMYAVIALELPSLDPRSLAILVRVKRQVDDVWFVERLGNVELDRVGDADLSAFLDPSSRQRTKKHFFGRLLGPQTSWWVRGNGSPSAQTALGARAV